MTDYEQKPRVFLDPRAPNDPHISVECSYCHTVIIPNRSHPKQVQPSCCEDCLFRRNMETMSKLRRGKI